MFILDLCTVKEIDVHRYICTVSGYALGTVLTYRRKSILTLSNCMFEFASI